MKKIANYVSVGRYKNGGILGVGSHQLIISDREFWETAVIVISNWIEPNNPSNILDICMKKYPYLKEENIKKSIDLIERNNFLIDDNVFSQQDRYSRNKLYYNFNGGDPEKIQSNIDKSSVTIIGCGGIGNHISVVLATAGVKNIQLVDPDIIELSNLTRQVLFSEEDVGKYKVDILERELIKRNSNVNISKIKKKISSENDLDSIEKSNLFVISADSPSEIITWVNNSCVRREQSYVNVGYINDISLIGPFYIPHKTSCFDCAKVIPDTYEDDALKSNINDISKIFRPATFAPVNNMAAAFAANDIIRYLGGFGEILSANKRVGIYSNQLKIETQPMEINKGCKTCQAK